MVIVNFDIVMVTSTTDKSGIAELFQGRAAALFIVLAGLGLGLSSRRALFNDTLSRTFRRSMFLLCLGLINMLVFDADIIHYYAFYFIFGVWFLRAGNGLLWLVTLALPLVFVSLILTLDYDLGWNWETYTYSGFWSPEGAIRNLFFNGWHPIFPWLSFFILGIWLSRLDLENRVNQIRLVFFGGAIAIASSVLSTLIMMPLKTLDAELAIFASTAPIPPMPLYMVTGGATACYIIGLCLLVAPSLQKWEILDILAPAGRMTLSLYIAHILIGMGTLEALGLIGEQSAGQALFASTVFLVTTTLLAWLWSKSFKRGPLETLMRWVTS